MDNREPMIVICGRHGSTAWNETGKRQGREDIPLNNKGKDEARRLARALQDQNCEIDLIVTSGLLRASETGNIIRPYFSALIEQDEGLNECSFGDLEGLTEQEIKDSYGFSTRPDWSDRLYTYNFGLFGGEDQATVFTRHIKVLQRIYFSTEEYKTVLLVGHSFGLCTLISGLGYIIEEKLGRGGYRVIKYPSY